MKTLKVLAIGLSCWGIIMPRTQLLAAGPVKPQAAPRTSQAPVVQDVTMTPEGAVTGQLVGAQGAGVKGTEIAFLQGKRVVATTRTNSQGLFRVERLRAGVYVVRAGNSIASYRVWSPNTAPPSAQPQIVLLKKEVVVRGQDGVVYYEDSYEPAGVDAITLLLYGTAFAGVTLAGVALAEMDNLEDKVDRRLPRSP